MLLPLPPDSCHAVRAHAQSCAIVRNRAKSRRAASSFRALASETPLSMHDEPFAPCAPSNGGGRMTIFVLIAGCAEVTPSRRLSGACLQVGLRIALYVSVTDRFLLTRMAHQRRRSSRAHPAHAPPAPRCLRASGQRRVGTQRWIKASHRAAGSEISEPATVKFMQSTHLGMQFCNPEMPAWSALCVNAGSQSQWLFNTSRACAGGAVVAVRRQEQ